MEQLLRKTYSIVTNIYWNLHKPQDGSGLAVARIMFGLLMMIDIPQERAMSFADHKWADEFECRFPLFDSLEPLPLKYMYLTYLIMYLGAVGIAIGLLFRFSCLCFLCPYVYLFLLDKTSWNNHSYLYGLLALLLTISSANNVWSFDSWLGLNGKNKRVPFWNYLILRTQMFLVYFLAGLKKLDQDWIQGHSVKRLSYHWTFSPFTLILPKSAIDTVIVHHGGLLIDLTSGFLLLHPKTRKIAFFFGGCFNIMNSQIFTIGMFPFMMLSMMSIFCSTDWPRNFLSEVNRRLRPQALQKNSGEKKKSEPDIDEKNEVSSGRKLSVTCFLALYILAQCFLPYSHSLTKGYNNWTNGLYGYSWDMMVHSWQLLHVKVTVKNTRTNEITYLNPEKWTRSKRWTSHADMVKQFSSCVQDRMRSRFNVTDIEMYIDSWQSLNGRFGQRMFDPKVDIIKARWSPFEEVSWVLPLLSEFSDWRLRLQQLDSEHDTDVTFIADFPGLSLVDYVDSKYTDTRLEVLKGDIEVKLQDGKTTKLTVNESFKVPSGVFHEISPIKHRPACYMYVYSSKSSNNETTEFNEEDTYSDYGQEFWAEKFNMFHRCFTMTYEALKCIVTGSDMIIQ